MVGSKTRWFQWEEMVAAAVVMIHEMMSSRMQDKAKIACDLWEDEDETGRVRVECRTLQRRGPSPRELREKRTKQNEESVV